MLFSEIAFLIGRVIYGVFFLIMAMDHFVNIRELKDLSASRGMKLPTFVIIATGLIIFAASLAILLGIFIEWAVLLIVVFLIPVTLMTHNFWKDTDLLERTNRKKHFLKNMAIMSAALMMLAVPQPWPWSLNI